MQGRVDTKKIRISRDFHYPRYITGGRPVRASFLEVRSFRKGITLVGFAQAVQNCSRTKFFHGAAMAEVLFITRYPWTGFACSERVALPHHQQDDHLDSGEMVKSDTLKF